MSGNARRYFIRFSYIGTGYRGSQKHVSDNLVDVDSIQGTVESAFFKLTPKLTKAPNLVMAGRTDAGVHALTSVAHIDLECIDGSPIDTKHVIKFMNRYLMNCNHEIRIHEFYQVSEKFHARHMAKNRVYLYRFLVSKEPNFHQVPIAEMNRTTHLQCENFDSNRFKKGLEIFKGIWDFTTFSGKSINKYHRDEYYFKSHIKTMNCWLEEAHPLMPPDRLSSKFGYYHVYFSSKGFLYNQIRKIMGALFALANQKVTEDDILRMLQVPNRAHYRFTSAAPHGLYLKHIEYDKDDIREIFEE